MTPAADWRGDSAYIGKTVQITGEIHSEEDLAIEGEVSGSIRLPNQRLTVGPMGRIKADVIAREVIVHGNVQGNIQAQDRVEIRKTGSVLGDLKLARISIEDGAYFKGHIDIQVKAAAAAAASAPRVEAKAPAPAAAAPSPTPLLTPRA